jgi:hypothetical protein
MFRKGWEGHLRQYTEAHTIEASPAAFGGMSYPGMLTQGSWGSHGTPWHPVEDPVDPLQLGNVPQETLPL